MTQFLLSFALQTPLSKTKLSRYSLNLLASWISLLSEWGQPTGHPFPWARQLSHKSCSLFRLQGHRTALQSLFQFWPSLRLLRLSSNCLSSISLLSIYFLWGCRRNINWLLAHCYFAQGQKPSSLTWFSLSWPGLSPVSFHPFPFPRPMPDIQNPIKPPRGSLLWDTPLHLQTGIGNPSGRPPRVLCLCFHAALGRQQAVTKIWKKQAEAGDTKGNLTHHRPSCRAEQEAALFTLPVLNDQHSFDPHPHTALVTKYFVTG